MTSSPIRRCIVALSAFVFGVMMLVAIDARADSASDSAQARALFFEARKLMADSHYDEACPKLEESERLDPGMGTEFNLADCYEHIGKLVSALALFERVIAQSHDSAQQRHEALARKRVEALSARVPTLVIDVADDARVSGLEIKRDGDVIAAVAWSKAIPVDPGRHVLAARAPDRVAWERTIDVIEGEHATVRVPMLDPIAPPSIAPPPTPTATQVIVPPAPPSAPIVDDGRSRRTIGIIVGGVGGAAIAVGGVLGALSLVSRDDARQWCNASTNGCTSQLGIDARESAVARGNASTGFFIAGGALVGAGVVLWLTAPRASVVHVGIGGGSGPRISARVDF